MEPAGYVCRRYVRHNIGVLANLEMPVALTKVTVNVDSQFQSLTYLGFANVVLD